MERDIEDYIRQLEKRLVLLEGRVAMLEAERYKPVPTTVPNTNPWNEPPNMPTFETTNKCSVCGLDFGYKAWGYVCMHPKCPSIARSVS